MKCVTILWWLFGAAWTMMATFAVAEETRPTDVAAASQPDPGDVLMGRVLLIDASLEKAMKDLRQGDIRGFMAGYLQLAKHYGSFADHIGAECRELGSSQAELALAECSLEEMIASSQATKPQAEKPVAMTQVRASLLKSLETAHREYQAAENGHQRNKALRSMKDARDRLKTIDQWLLASEGSTRMELPFEQLNGQIETLTGQVHMDAQATELAATLVREAVTEVMSEIQDALALLKIQAHLPKERVDSLQETSQSVHEAFRQVKQLRAKSQMAVEQAVDSDMEMTAEQQEAILSQVKALLGPAAEPDVKSDPAISTDRPVSVRRCRIFRRVTN
jgi:hypothetical protein